ncbi:MAG TPA: sigma-70 family RNA polymerase sigma factor [Candidatus Polarisedimenticolaceae bacterium]|nr:sigma-70 family RNA polymerase sigma factor [Candidatus Polarisedimenticolaceae bacterium]
MGVRRTAAADERGLVASMLAGDERAFADFFDGYAPGLYRFALTRLRGDEDAAEDVAQATMAAAIRKLSTYRGEATLFTWLCTFCRHEIAEYCRRARRDQVQVGLVEDDPAIAAALDSLAAGSADQEALVARHEHARLVHVVLDRLPPRYASALEWKYVDGEPVREIADRLQLTVKAAESLLTRAREAFREGFSIVTGGRA